MSTSSTLSRRGLQVCVAILSLIPLVSGGLSLLRGVGPLPLPDAQALAGLDNQTRFLNGVWFAVGLLLLAILPRIEHHASAVRFIGVAVFIGGVGRLLSVLMVGPPIPRLWGSMALELVVVPLLILWHARVAKAAASASAP